MELELEQTQQGSSHEVSVAGLEQDKLTQALEILKLKRKVKKLEKKKKSRSLGFKRLRKIGTSHRVESSVDTVVGSQEDASKQRGEIETIDADEDVTLVDVETQDEEVAYMDVELQGRIDQDDEVNAASKGVSVAEPTVSDDEEVTMTNRVYQVQERHLDNIRKYQSLKKKTVSIAQARKNMIIYLKNMIGYKMEHFRGMTYDNESFKKLKAVEVSGSDSIQEIPSNDPKETSEEDVQNMLEIILVSEFKVEALQVKYPIIDWEIHFEGSRTYWKIIRVGEITEAYQSFKDILKGFDIEDLVALWNLVKEKFSSAVPNVDKEKALYVETKRLFKPDVDDVLWKLQRHDMFMLIEKDYPLSNGVMTLMLSAKLQVEEDSEMARDLVMKIFIEANKPKRRKSRFHIDSKSLNKVSVIVVLDLSKVANPLYSLRDKDLFKSKDPQCYGYLLNALGYVRLDYGEYGRKMVKDIRVEIHGYDVEANFVVVDYVMDIQKKDKNKAKPTKPSTGLERE
nr:hypothetical protein [Tanacetum cinerariifolium]